MEFSRGDGWSHMFGSAPVHLTVIEVIGSITWVLTTCAIASSVVRMHARVQMKKPFPPEPVGVPLRRIGSNPSISFYVIIVRFSAWNGRKSDR